MVSSHGLCSSGRGSRSFFCESAPETQDKQRLPPGVDPPAIALMGVDHRSAPVEIRERLSSGVQDYGRTVMEALGPDMVSETALLSTCNRFEVFFVPAGSLLGIERRLLTWMAGLSGTTPHSMETVLYRLSDRAAVSHLLRVACGLDSQMLGETQILGQVAQTLVRCRAEGTVGPLLNYVFSRAVYTGKRARAETPISCGKTSVSRAAADLVAIHLQQADRAGTGTVVLIGAGETALLVAEALAERCSGRLVCVNRSLERAQQVASRVGCEVLPWSALGGALVTADAAVTATSAPHAVLRREDILPVIGQREGRPLLIVDIAVPRDVQPSVGELPSVTLIDIDHLEACLDHDRAQREAAVPQVERIVQEETAEIMEWLHGRKVAPLIRQFRSRARSIADAEASRALGRLGDLGPREREVVLALARQVANKILHEPTVRLKDLVSEEDGNRHLETFMKVFGLGYNGRDDPEPL